MTTSQRQNGPLRRARTACGLVSVLFVFVFAPLCPADESDQATQKWIAALSRGTYKTRTVAARALGETGKGKAAEALIAELSQVPIGFRMTRPEESLQFASFRDAVMRSLVAIGSEAVPALRTELKNGKSRMRAEVAHCLGEIGPSAAPAADALASLIDSSDDPFAQQQAAAALGKIGPAARLAIPALQRMAANDKSARLATYTLLQISPDVAAKLGVPAEVVKAARERLDRPVEIGGVLPGVTRETEVLKSDAWGEPQARRTIDEGISLLVYEKERARFEMTVERGRVKTIDEVPAESVSIGAFQYLADIEFPVRPAALSPAARVGTPIPEGWVAARFYRSRGFVLYERNGEKTAVHRIRYFASDRSFSTESYLGCLFARPNRKERIGARIAWVMPGSPADEGGLLPGDLLTAIGGHAIQRIDQVLPAIEKLQPGEKIPTEVIRDRRVVRSSIVLKTRELLTVDAAGGGDFQTLGDALRVASAGTKILVRPGLYFEIDLDVSIPVEIQGSGRRGDVVIECTSSMRLRAGGAAISGLTMHKRMPPDWDERIASAILMTGGTHAVSNCEFVSDTGSGINVSRKSTSAYVADCLLHDCRSYGLCFQRTSTGLVERCESYGNGVSGMAVSNGANPLVRDSILRDGQQAGLYIFKQGRGVFERCTIFGNKLSGVDVGGGSNPTLRECVIRDGKLYGVLVKGKSTGEFSDCRVTGNASSGMRIRGESKPALSGTRFENNGKSGLYVYGKSMPRVDGCTFSQNTLAGIDIDETSKPVVQNCTIENGKSYGLLIRGGAAPEISKTIVSRNARSGVRIKEAAVPLLDGCTISGNGEFGISLSATAQGRVKNCTIRDNAKGPRKTDRGAKTSFE